MADSIKTTPRKIIALQKHTLTLENNAQERMCVYPIFHHALEKVKWNGEASLLQGPDTQKQHMKASLLMKIGSYSYFASFSPHQGPQRRSPR